MSTKDFLLMGKETNKGSALHSVKDEGAAGAYDFATLAFTGILVDQETFELGSDVYEVNLVATDTGAEAAADFDEGFTSIVFDTAPTIPLLPGDVIRMESEFMIVIDYNVNGPSANVLRGQFGSADVTHSIANSDTFQAAQPVVAGNFAIPVTVTDESVADAQIAAAVQFWSDGYSKGLGGGIGVRVQNGLKVDAVNAVNDQVVFAYAANGGVAATLATDMTNATITAFGGGVEEASQTFSKVVVKASGTGALVFFAPWVVDEAYVTIWGADGAIIEAAANTVSVLGGRVVTVSAAGSLAAGVSVEVTFTKA